MGCVVSRQEFGEPMEVPIRIYKGLMVTATVSYNAFVRRWFPFSSSQFRRRRCIFYVRPGPIGESAVYLILNFSVSQYVGS